MHEVGDGWWTLHKDLPRGSFAYQFQIDKRFVICDPYARFVAEDPGDAPRKAIVKPRQEPYVWKHDAWQRPRFEDLMIYELHIADFTPQRDFREAVAYLDHVRNLGVNAIELMPVFGVHENKGWGYAPTFLFAPNEDYGTPSELKWFIDEAHGKGMAIILDMVLAHTGPRHPFNELYPYDQSPWYGNGPAGSNEYGFPQLDYSKPATRIFVKDVLEYWLTEFHIDGYRFDYIRNIGVTPDGYGVPTLSWAARSIRRDVYLIGEHLPEDPGLMLFADMDGAWHVRFCQALRALLCQQERFGYRWEDFETAIRTLDPGNQGYGSRPTCMVNYIESHDEERVVLDIKNAGFDEEIARRKSALGATVMFTAVGEPMLYHGQTWGQDTPKNLDHNYLNWEKLDTPGGLGLRDHHIRLANLRRERDALRTTNISIDRIQCDQKCVAYHRWNDAGDEVVVAANFSGEDQRFKAPFPNGGKWREFFSGEECDMGHEADIELDRWAAKIYLRA